MSQDRLHRLPATKKLSDISRPLKRAPSRKATPGSALPQQMGGNQATKAALQTASGAERIRESSRDHRKTATDNLSARSALTGIPSRRLRPPDGGKPVDVYDTAAARQAADQMGAFGFAYRESIFLGRDPGIPGAPTKDEVLQHEMVHVLQSRQMGSVASQGDLERQAHQYRPGERLLPADAEQAHGLLWIPVLLVGGYILLKSNTANAPRPGEKTYKSMDAKDYGKMITQAVVLGSGGLVASALRKAGYGVVTTWGVSGAYGSVAYRATQDVYSGSFSGVDAYIVDGLTGATIGVVVGGAFYAFGKLPGISKAREWFMRGSQGDEAWAKLSFKEKMHYEIGQKTLSSAEDFAKAAHLSPSQRGAQFVKEQGWLRALFPQSAKFMPGTGGTFSTGPTAAARWFGRAAPGFGAGAAGNYLIGDIPRHLWGVDPDGPDSSAAPLVPGRQSSLSSPPVIMVVPEGKELEYYLKSGRLGDFPVPEGTSGLRDYAPAPRGGGLSMPSQTEAKTYMG